ncbi:MAG: tetratricopeptide repeat protein [Bacteroidota bacterium]|nr:tetratricopeptide repeat protein [Bacteroidota bacterium]
MALFILSAGYSFGQKERKFVREGNKLYEQALSDTKKLDTVTFNKAEIAYRKALNLKPKEYKWNFNLADALYKQKRFSEAEKSFKALSTKCTDKMDKARCFHNLGNSLIMQNKIDESIDAYKDALRLNPKDMDTKYNLAYAQSQKKKQNDKNNKNNKNNKNQQNKNNKNNQNKNNQNKDQNKNQNKDQNKNNQNKQDQNSGLSKSNAQSILQALDNEEKNNQQKLRKLKAQSAQRQKIDKDW